MTSAARKWQVGKADKGLCQGCGGKLNHYKLFCDKCSLKVRARKRRYAGCDPWKAGGRGRPPIIHETQEK
jgi:predicted amidophosphoribosyltransferase